jgi:hypothetical protein
MKFNDRSISYESHPPDLELTQCEIGNKYRGTSWRQKYPRHIRATEPKIDLKYREVGYCTGSPEDIEGSLLKATSTAPKNNKAALTKSSRQQVLEELHDIHLSNIRHNLEHRLQVAREKGDQSLIRLLEAEFEQIA